MAAQHVGLQGGQPAAWAPSLHKAFVQSIGEQGGGDGPYTTKKRLDRYVIALLW